MWRQAGSVARRGCRVQTSSQRSPSSSTRWQHVEATTTHTTAQHQPVANSTIALPDSGQATAQNALAAYPTFNLNTEDGRPLGPRPGDSAILTLSGGVDSSVAAYMAVTAGGLIPKRTVFMRNWNGLEEGESFEPGAGGAQGCQWIKDWALVERTARWLDVKPELVDLSTAYWNNVFAPSLDAWQRGSTPNPDVMCNREIKFGELLQQIDLQEASSSTTADPHPIFGRRTTRTWLVTGHYAHLEYYYPAQQDDALMHGRLLRPKDRRKDQSFFLSAVPSVQLGRSHFPLALMPKTEVRRTAHVLGLPTSESKESMGLCFVGERARQLPPPPPPKKRHVFRSQRPPMGRGPPPTKLGFSGFLGDYIESCPGPIITVDGTELAKHDGLHTMTIGQGARLGGMSERHFVAAKDARTNSIVVVPGIDHPMLRCRTMHVNGFSFIDSTLLSHDDFVRALQDGQMYAQIRHCEGPSRCRVAYQGEADGTSRSKHNIAVHFDTYLLGVADGQTCAVYAGDRCIGSGTISSIETEASYHRMHTT